jgi:4-amino-4-deoxy-L-arabinose transferase-like glycosyltransferase
MSRRTFAYVLTAIFAVGLFMRVAWLRADPPVADSVGIVWHDEGAWVHNARNRALWGAWRTDAWNPVFVAPVFTALEYASFETFGVGLWQARVVPLVSGLVAIIALVIGLKTIAGREAAAIGAAVLATTYAFVMWNRAALMESTMTAAMVVAWAAYARGSRDARWGAIAGVAAAGAWFTKAAAAFFIAALALDAGLAIIRAWRADAPDRRADTRLARWTLAGLAITFAIAGTLFVLPHWADYRFYNWQMSVTRKPAYTLHAFLERASWLPVAEGILSRMWLVLVAAAIGLAGIVHRWRDAKPAERLLVLWVLIGFAELVVHDSGNERRYVMFIPALTALAAPLAARAWTNTSASAPESDGRARVARALISLPLAYIVAGSLLRPLVVADIDANPYRIAVRLAAAIAVLWTTLQLWKPRWTTSLVSTASARARVAAMWLILVLSWNAFEYVRWTQHRSDVNYEASVALGRLLPPGTIVQGKLANGLALDNRIRPLFVGNGFGNYDDRLHRDDARYILTYDLPRIGYESSDGSGLIQGILDRYPRRRVVATFTVDETPDPDRAVLIDKMPTDEPHARD